MPKNGPDNGMKQGPVHEEKFCFSFKSTSLKENYLASNNDEGVMRRPQINEF